jgi:hypothetical protein
MITATSFQPSSDVKFTKPSLNKSGGKSVVVLNAKTNKALYLSTPLMLTWGVQEFVDEASGRRSYDMSLQFPSEEYQSEQTTNFLNAMIGFQDKIKADAVTNSKEWLGKAKMSSEVVDALFHPMLRYPKDPDTGEPNMARAPTLRIKLPYWEEAFNCEIYDDKSKCIFPNEGSELGPVELIPKSTQTAVVIRCGGLWFANGKFGCTWRLEQAVVKPKFSMKGKCMIQLSEEDREQLGNQSTTTTSDDEETAGVEVADSDEECGGVEENNDGAAEEVEAESEVAAEQPVAKKKVVRRKKDAP